MPTRHALGLKPAGYRQVKARVRGRRLPAVAIALAACAPTRQTPRPTTAPTVTPVVQTA